MKKTVSFFIVSVVIIFIFINLGKFFDISKQAKLSDIIVSLGGDKGLRIKKTLSLYDANMSKSSKIILTGIDDFDPSMKLYELDWRADYLSKKGIDRSNIVFNTKAQNTLEEIFYIKRYMSENNLHSVIFITDAPHSRRIGFFASQVAHYEDANISYEVVATSNDWWSRDTYYKNPDAVIFVVNEAIKLTYYYIQNKLGNLHVN